MTWPRCSTWKAWRSARPPLRPPADAALWRPATCRASLAFYNTHDEVDAFVAALGKVRKLLG
jgi:selenocysteine lyase/cysteine desulfurase